MNKNASLYKRFDDWLRNTPLGKWNEKHKKEIIITFLVELVVLAVVLVAWYYVVYLPHHHIKP